MMGSFFQSGDTVYYAGIKRIINMIFGQFENELFVAFA